MKDIKREQLRLILNAILKSIAIIIIGYFIATNFVINEKRLVIERDGLITDINPNIRRKLDVVDNYDLKNVKRNRVVVTNNSGDVAKYQVILMPINKNEEDIMINFNDYVDRTLNRFEKKDNYYILYEGSLEYQYSSILDIKVYTKENKKINVNFKLKVIKV